MLEQPGAVAQRLAHQCHVKILEVAETAVNHLRRRRRSLRAAAALLEERDVVVAAGQLPRDPRAVDPAADDREPHGDDRTRFSPDAKKVLPCFGPRFEMVSRRWPSSSSFRPKRRLTKREGISRSCSPAVAH